MDKCRPGYAQLTTHAFSSAEALIDHLTSVNAVNFVCRAAMDEDMPPSHKSVYQIVSGNEQVHDILAQLHNEADNE